mmetsp:Transcript_48265/g.59359  ORF Transcript_48265/g.59359 Transcript_48265/m.59359 type:complete len:109 (+) Transcript_48265:312-638(+)
MMITKMVNDLVHIHLHILHMKKKSGKREIYISIMSIEFSRWQKAVQYEIIGIDKTKVKCFKRYNKQKCGWDIGIAKGDCKYRDYQDSQDCNIKETEIVFRALIAEKDQ